MTVYNAVADLGWTPGTDVSSNIATFFSGTAQAGDTLHLDSATRFDLTYATSGQMTMPNNFTLSAVDGGGFNILSSTTGGSPYFNATLGCTFLNLTVHAPNSPWYNLGRGEGGSYVGNNPVPGTDHDLQRFIYLNAGADDVVVRNCNFEGQIEIWIRVVGGGASPGINDFLMEGSRIRGGKYSTNLLGNVYRPIFRDNYFEYAMIDSIKTSFLSASTPSLWIGPTSDGVVINSQRNQFKNNNRDCWDTTGGMTNFILEDDKIQGCNYLDLKHPVKELGDPANDVGSVWNPYTNYGNVGITVRRAHLIQGGFGGFAVVTTDTPAGELVGISDFNRVNVRDITVEDCIWDVTSPPANTAEFIQLKTEDNISVTGLEVRGWTGSFSEWDAAWEVRLGNAGYPPTGWTPPTPRSASGTTQVAANTDPLPTLSWSKVAASGPTTGAVFTSSSGSMLLIGGKPLIL